MSVRHWLRRLIARPSRTPASPAAASMANETYEADFVQYLAQTKHLSETEVRAGIARSQHQFSGGWGGPAYRDFTERALEVLRPLHDDAPADLFETYRIHAPFDFLRMLSYPIPGAAQLEEIVSTLDDRGASVLVDYGCGLAQRSVAIARALTERGREVTLVLVDLRRTPHVEFLAFICDRHGIRSEFLEVSAETPFPSLPAHDYCEAINVLEHVPEPLRVIDSIDASLRRGGLLAASVADQATEMMHVSPALGQVRHRLAELGYVRRRDWLEATVFEKA